MMIPLRSTTTAINPAAEPSTVPRTPLIMKKTWLAVELTFVFILLPGLIYLLGKHAVGFIIPTLLLVGGYCYFILRRDHALAWKQFHDRFPLRKHWKNIVLRAATGGLLMLLVIHHFIPEKLFYLPRELPHIWCIVMIGYPLVSVYPQEFIYRVFFFHRYSPLFGTNRSGELTGFLVCGLVFGWAHIVFHNWQAPLLTILGGWLFSWTYKKTDSLLCCCVEHAIWGNMIFTFGLGHYFYGGSVID